MSSGRPHPLWSLVWPAGLRGHWREAPTWCLVCLQRPALPLGAGAVRAGCPGSCELSSQVPWRASSRRRVGDLGQATKALGRRCPQGSGSERRDANVLAAKVLKCLAGALAQAPLYVCWARLDSGEAAEMSETVWQ